AGGVRTAVDRGAGDDRTALATAGGQGTATVNVFGEARRASEGLRFPRSRVGLPRMPPRSRVGLPLLLLGLGLLDELLDDAVQRVVVADALELNDALVVDDVDGRERPHVIRPRGLAALAVPPVRPGHRRRRGEVGQRLAFRVAAHADEGERLL